MGELPIFQSNNWIFISFEQAGRGHRLARILSCLPDVHWYSSPENGINPWNVGRPHGYSQQRRVSRFHYDRFVGDQKLPPPHDYVENFIPDIDEYYQTTFYNDFINKGGWDILQKKRMIYCTHSLPGPIYRQFPNAKIINIVHDIDKCVERYMQVGYVFPGAVKHTGTLPEDNPRVRYLQDLKNKKPDLKVRDVWAWEKMGVFWADGMFAEMQKDVRKKFTDRRAIRENMDVLNIMNLYDVKDYKSIKEFIYG